MDLGSLPRILKMFSILMESGSRTIAVLKGGIRLSGLAIKTKKEFGDRSYPIWLLVNPKYPAVIHDIWKPILYEIQDIVYRQLHARIDTENILIKNAFNAIEIVPKTSNCWTAEVAKEIVMLRESVLEHRPKILITFGTITYEFVRRIFKIRLKEKPEYWCAANLGNEFERSIANFDINQTNTIPLLSRVMKSGKFIEDGNYSSWEDSENYFRDVGTKIANRIIENKDSLKVWIE